MRETRTSHKNSFMKNVVILMFSQVIIKIVGLIYKLYLTNKEGFGDKGNAIYSAGFQIYALLLTLCSIGVPNAISSLVSAKVAVGDNKGAHRIFKIAFAIFGFIGFICSSILFLGAKNIACNYLEIPEVEMVLIALSPSIFIVSIASVLRGYFNGRENISVTANSQSYEQVLKTLLTIIIVEIISYVSIKNTVLMAAGATIATTLSNAFSLVYLFTYYIKHKKEVWREVISSTVHKKDSIGKIIKNILIVCVPISLGALLSVTNKTIDAFTVVKIAKRFLGEEIATIQYGILSGKVETLITLPFSFNIAFATTLVPTIAASIAKHDIKTAQKRIKFSILLSILIGLPCSAVMSIFAEPILKLLFPNAHEGAVMLKLSSWSIIFVVLMQTINGALQGLGKVNIPVVALGIGVVIKFTLNILLVRIKEIGVNGAIISSLVSHMVTFIICLIYLIRCIDIKFNISKMLIKPIIATFIMSFASLYIYNELNINLITSLMIGVIIYGILILALKILSKDELFMIPYGQKVYKLSKKRRKSN